MQCSRDYNKSRPVLTKHSLVMGLLYLGTYWRLDGEG